MAAGPATVHLRTPTPPGDSSTIPGCVRTPSAAGRPAPLGGHVCPEPLLRRRVPMAWARAGLAAAARARPFHTLASPAAERTCDPGTLRNGEEPRPAGSTGARASACGCVFVCVCARARVDESVRVRCSEPACVHACMRACLTLWLRGWRRWAGRASASGWVGVVVHLCVRQRTNVLERERLNSCACVSACARVLRSWSWSRIGNRGVSVQQRPARRVPEGAAGRPVSAVRRGCPSQRHTGRAQGSLPVSEVALVERTAELGSWDLAKRFSDDACIPLTGRSRRMTTRYAELPACSYVQYTWLATEWVHAQSHAV